MGVSSTIHTPFFDKIKCFRLLLQSRATNLITKDGMALSCMICPWDQPDSAFRGMQEGGEDYQLPYLFFLVFLLPNDEVKLITFTFQKTIGEATSRSTAQMPLGGTK